MLDKVLVQEILSEHLKLSSGECEIKSLRGDASNRRYYRLQSSGGGGPATSVILMELAEPEGFKKSEEMVSRSRIEIQELPYINIQRHLEACHVAVPRLYYYERQRGWLFLEDLGDVTLWEELGRSDPRAYRGYYVRAIEELVKLQIEATRRDHSGCIAFGRAFDIPLLMWECDHFLEYGVETHGGKKMSPSDRQAVRGYFERLVRPLAAEPRYFTHRDYHSRNLMIQDGNIRVLDFQDALMGPAQYDLASLLRDSYVTLPEGLIDELLREYMDRREAAEGSRLDRKQFIKLFDWMSIQRNLKAAGRFAYIDSVKNNPHYLQFIPPTLEKVRHNLSKYPELSEIKTILSRYLEAFQ